MRRSGRQPDDLAGLGGGSDTGPQVVVEVCRCGCSPTDAGHAAHAAHPEWPLAVAWSWLTRPVEPAPEQLETDVEAEAADDDAPDPASLPWWDARSGAAKRRAVLPLVLLGELQAGVLLRALYEVMRGPGSPSA